MGVAGETVLLVPPLSLPDVGRAPDPRELERYEAIRLFVDRANSAAPTFELDERNAQAVALLCRNLDGIPLAIELAAARTKVLSVAQISYLLAENFQLLKSASRTADPRQQTLAATLEWSHELLDEAERAVFRRLSVFAGGFTLGAAEQVCVGGDIEEDDVLDLLTRLIDKSLVSVAEYGGAEARYRLLETVRQYAWEKLLGSEETDAVGARHVLFFLDFAEEVERRINSADRPRWLKSTTAFKLKKAGSSTSVGATVTYDAAARKATLDPNAGLSRGVTYVATVTTGAKDLAGNALDQNAATTGSPRPGSSPS